MDKDKKGPLLQISELAVHYPIRNKSGFGSRPLKAVDGVSLTIQAGECLGLVGESGCGKSTLAQAVLGLVPITKGTIYLNGGDVVATRKKNRMAQARSVQMVFQDPFASLNPRQTIYQTLSNPLKLHGVKDKAQRDARVVEMLSKVGLKPELSDRYAHEFSGGQRQRICIARALILNPKLVICDEPVSALDVSIRAQIINLLLDLKDDLGIALLMISHDLGVVEHMSDRIAVMYLGHIVEEGNWKSIFTSPSHPYTNALIAAIPDPLKPTSLETRMTGETPSALTPPAGCPFHPRCKESPGEICRKNKIPEFVQVGNDHQARCHLLSQPGSRSDI